MEEITQIYFILLIHTWILLHFSSVTNRVNYNLHPNLHRRIRPPSPRNLTPSQRNYYVRTRVHTQADAAYFTGNTLFPMCYTLDSKLFLRPHSVPNKELTFLVELHARQSNFFLPSYSIPHGEHSNNDNHGNEVWFTSNKGVTPITPRNRNSVA